MQGKEQDATDENLAALQAYLHTLSPPPSLATARGILGTEAIQRGRQVFHRTGCIDCHREPSYTSPMIYDVGLRDELGTKKFNPPSLRGVSQGGPYFHDNRAKTLNDVFAKYKHKGSGDLERNELRDLLEFLKGL